MILHPVSKGGMNMFLERSSVKKIIITLISLLLVALLVNFVAGIFCTYRMRDEGYPNCDPDKPTVISSGTSTGTNPGAEVGTPVDSTTGKPCATTPTTLTATYPAGRCATTATDGSTVIPKGTTLQVDGGTIILQEGANLYMAEPGTNGNGIYISNSKVSLVGIDGSIIFPTSAGDVALTNSGDSTISLSYKDGIMDVHYNGLGTSTVSTGGCTVTISNSQIQTAIPPPQNCQGAPVALFDSTGTATAYVGTEGVHTDNVQAYVNTRQPVGIVGNEGSSSGESSSGESSSGESSSGESSGENSEGSSCTSDSECPSGQTCQVKVCRPYNPTNECASDIDCGTGKKCVGGDCVANNCDSDCSTANEKKCVFKDDKWSVHICKDNNGCLKLEQDTVCADGECCGSGSCISTCGDSGCEGTTWIERVCATDGTGCKETQTQNSQDCAECSIDSDCSDGGCSGFNWVFFVCNQSKQCQQIIQEASPKCKDSKIVFKILDMGDNEIEGDLKRQGYRVSVSTEDERRINEITEFSVEADSDDLGYSVSDLTTTDDIHYYSIVTFADLSPDEEWKVNINVAFDDEYGFKESHKETRDIQKKTYLNIPRVVIQ